MEVYKLKRVENNIAKGEIASFQKSSAAEVSESIYMWGKGKIMD